jgi:exosome complex component RRP46
MSPELTTHPLIRADGSATFSSNLFTILAAVNGPVEVQRRDELPEEAAVEVNIRPSSGIGGPRERWMETVIASLIRSLLLGHLHPRTLVQVTLQVTREPGLKLKRGVLDVAIIPALANAAFLALVDAALPLEGTMVAALGCLMGEGEVVIEPTEKQMVGCKSVHAMAYDLRGGLLLDESAGDFGVEEWEQVADALKEKALAAMAPAGEDESMSNGVDDSTPWLRQRLEEDVRKAGAWRESG